MALPARPFKRPAQTENEQPQSEQLQNEATTPNFQMLETEQGPIPVFGTFEWSKNLAIVDVEVLKKLTALLQHADLREIIDNMINKLRTLKNDLYHETFENTSAVKMYTDMLSEELRFHKTVNDISLYKNYDEAVKAETVAEATE